jgi:RHH-type proline utilization regulon transcriptional repressor/proline dehydrogenase/delta 1-pyrroline-5-carboxylate dehydrogenase
VIDWLHALAVRLDRKIMVRLVKGAYWDAEIKRAQVWGCRAFPVFTRKAATDVSYIANARKLIGYDRPHLSAVRHPQRPYRRGVLHLAGGRRAAAFRIPAPAWHGRAAA